MTNSNDMPLAARPLDRAGHHRTDADWLEAAFLREDVLVLMLRDGCPFAGSDGGLVWMGPEVEKVSPGAPRLFLGNDTRGTPIFAIDLPREFDTDASLVAGIGEFVDFRAAAARMNDLDANCASTARSLFLWHAAHGFCAKCGAGTVITEAGWKRMCPACSAEHFPRTDPVAIMLAVKEDKCLIGRQAMWPAGFVSCLAGYCEPGETIEQAASRELLEEAGIRSDPAKAEYIACQPWPFPSSLMVGLILEAENEDITIDPKELESAEWISRDALKAMLAGTHESLFCPPPMAIAHHLLKIWAERG